jgi:glycerol-3-phosphate dehydrogenase subunit C
MAPSWHPAAASSRSYDSAILLDAAGKLDRDFGPCLARWPLRPCHQRERASTSRELLAMVRGTAPDRVGEPLDCCGLGGIMGFKKKFTRPPSPSAAG